MSKSLKPWEIALLIGLIAMFAVGAWAGRTQQELSDKLVRLHVVANSDSADDQALKLTVRDAILEISQELLAQTDSADNAQTALAAALPQLEAAAAATIKALGYDYGVKAALARESFPTREYDGFALPAGEYQALRVTIGEGAGQNWWCVVFPPLCNQYGSFAQTAKEAGLTDDEITMITETDGVQIRFKCLEILEKLKHFLGE